MSGALVMTNGEGASGMLQAIHSMKIGESRLTVVEEAIKVVELDPSVRTVGLGGAPNLLGEVECDAAIMDGLTLQCGAVGALRGYTHAIVLARAVMEKLPHVFLAGEGAARLAREIGQPSANLLTEDAVDDYSRWLNTHVSRDTRSPESLLPYIHLSTEPLTAKGTKGFLVRDISGNLAGGTSTSGWAYKYPGRLGDSPIIGAGLYVHNQYGGAFCTHTGEVTIRLGTARSVVLYMKMGMSVEEACREAVNDIKKLKGGYIGPIVIHAIDALGTPFAISTYQDPELYFWLWKDEWEHAQQCIPNVELL